MFPGRFFKLYMFFPSIVPTSFPHVPPFPSFFQPFPRVEGPYFSRSRVVPVPVSFRSATEALDIAVLSATVAAAGLGALLAEAAVITALLVTGLTVYTFRSLGAIGRWKHWSCDICYVQDLG